MNMDIELLIDQKKLKILGYLQRTQLQSTGKNRLIIKLGSYVTSELQSPIL